MDHQTGRFIDHQKVGIFEGDIEFHGFRPAGNADFCQRLHDHLLAARNAIAGPHGLAVDGDVALEEPAFEAAT